MKNITKQLSILLFALTFINQIKAIAQECKTTPKITTLNVACDLTVENGICLFSGQKPLVISTELNTLTNVAVNLEIYVADCKGNKTTLKAGAKQNSKTGNYDATFIASETNCMYSLDSIAVTLVNSCGEAFVYGQSAKLDAPFTNFTLLLNGSKRSAKYGQCWVFAKSAGENGNIVKLDELSVTQRYSEGLKTENSSLDIVLQINDVFQERTGNLESLLTWGEVKMAAVVTVEHENGKTETKTIQAKRHIGNLLHTIQDSYPRDHGTRSRIKAIELQFTNTCNETFTLETEYQSGYTEPTSNFHVWNEVWSINQKTNQGTCDVKYKAENAMLNINDEKDVIAIYSRIGFNAGDDVPSSIKAIVEMVNCKNESVYITIEMKSDEKEPWMWTGSQAIFQKADCSLGFVGIKYIALSPCKEEFTGEAIIPEGQLKKAKSGMNIFVAKLNFATTTSDVY